MRGEYLIPIVLLLGLIPFIALIAILHTTLALGSHMIT